jgi:hypothetical protein
MNLGDLVVPSQKLLDLWKDPGRCTCLSCRRDIFQLAEVMDDDMLRIVLPVANKENIVWHSISLLVVVHHA